MKRVLLLLSVAMVSMAPGYGRPSMEIQIDRLISTYEESMEPNRIADWLQTQLASETGWDGVERRPNDVSIYRKGSAGVTAIRTPQNLTWLRKSEDGTEFMATVFFVNPLQAGSLRVRADGIQIHSSLMVDGSIVWAFQHPDGRVFRRTQMPDGTISYAGPK